MGDVSSGKYLSMRLSLIILSLLTLKASAELPIISDGNKWLGYFVAWEEKYYDYGFGDDGKGKMHIVKGKEQMGHTDFNINVKIQEELKGKWVSRNILDESGLTSDAKSGVDPRGPVKVLFAVTGDTKVEVIQVMSRGRIVIKPRIVEKKTKNPVRVIVEVSIPDLYKIKEELTAKELKKKIGSDTFVAKRANDGKRVKVKLYETETDLMSDKLLAEGATELELTNRGKMGSKSFTAEQGGDEVGKFEITPGKEIYVGMKFKWVPDPAKLGEKDCYVSFAIK